MTRGLLSYIPAAAMSVTAVALAIGLIGGRTSLAGDTVEDSAPLVALSTAPFDESKVRDQDIEFYSRRLQEDPSSAADRAVLAGLLFTRSRNTGSTADLEHAEKLARESVANRSQRNSQAFQLLASLLMARHEFHEARSVAAHIDSLDPGNPAHLALLGEIELELGEYDSAAVRFEAIRYDGRNFTTGARLARWHEVTGRIDMARRLLQHAIARVDLRDDLPREQVAWFYYRLGELELRAGNVNAADSVFRIGLTRNAEDVRVLGGLARIALARGAWQQAIDFGERATTTQFDPAILGTISRAYAGLGDSIQAASYANAMSVSALNQPGPIHREWGLFLLDHGTARDRADILRRARRELRVRQDVYGHDLLAWALYRNGYASDARRQMTLALAQKTEDVRLAAHARAIGVAASSSFR